MLNKLKSLLKRAPKELQFSYEERQYSTGVMVLLILFTIVVFMVSQWAMDDLRDGIPRIPYPNYWSLPEVQQLDDYRRDTMQPLHEQLRNLEARRSDSRSNYDTTLLERIVEEDDSFYGGSEVVQVDIRETEAAIARVEESIDEAKIEEDRLSVLAESARKEVYKTHRAQVRVRQTKVFAWEALFWIPFFLLALMWNTRATRKESKWKIISLAVLVAAGITAVQSLCVFLWSWIPHELLEKLWDLIKATMVTRIVGYYLLIGILVLLFGWFIVMVHRRMTNPVRHGKKRIAQEKCPRCSYPLALSDEYCGGCTMQLKKKCGKCGKEGYDWQAACSHCGQK